MIEKTIAIVIMLTSGILSGLDMITLSPLADAQSNSRTDSEQDISQKNTCSGFSECLNDGANLVEAVLGHSIL